MPLPVHLQYLKIRRTALDGCHSSVCLHASRSSVPAGQTACTRCSWSDACSNPPVYHYCSAAYWLAPSPMDKCSSASWGISTSSSAPAPVAAWPRAWSNPPPPVHSMLAWTWRMTAVSTSASGHPAWESPRGKISKSIPTQVLNNLSIKPWATRWG
ncbi:hypothetical protein D3C84_731080 [compost metagenome]